LFVLSLITVRFRPFVSAWAAAFRLPLAVPLRLALFVPASAPPLRLQLAVPRRLAPLAPLAPPALAAAGPGWLSCWGGCSHKLRSSGGGILALCSPALGLSHRPPLAVHRAPPMAPPGPLSPLPLVSSAPSASLSLAPLTSTSACLPVTPSTWFP